MEGGGAQGGETRRGKEPLGAGKAQNAPAQVPKGCLYRASGKQTGRVGIATEAFKKIKTGFLP